MMNAPRAPHHRDVRYNVRYQARLNAETSAKLEELASTFDRKRSVILRYVLRWGLTQTQGWTIEQSITVTVQTVTMLVEPELLQQVQHAAAAHGTTGAAWLRHAMRQVTPEDFPPNWRAGETALPSHDSGHYQRRFMLRLDENSVAKLERLSQHFDTSAAEIIRQLIAQATLKDFPESWQLAAEECRARRAPPRSE